MKKKHIKLVKGFIKDLKSGSCGYFLCNYLEFQKGIPPSEVNDIVEELADWGKKNLKEFRHDAAFIYNNNEHEPSERYVKNKIKHFKGFLEWHKERTESTN